MPRSVGVVVPAYRPEVDPLAAYVRAIEENLDPETIRIELDEPSPSVLSALRDLPVTIGTADRRRGKGAAITVGFETLDTDVLAFVDADGSTPVSSLADVIEPVQDGEVSMAVGSRRHPDARIHSHQTYARRWLGHGFVHLARALLDIDLYDYQCGAKAIDRDAWEVVRSHLYEPGFAWDIELVAMADALGFDVREIPIEWEDHPGSTVSTIGTSYRLARALFAVRHRARLVRDHPLHVAIDSYRERRLPLIERAGVKDD